VVSTSTRDADTCFGAHGLTVQVLAFFRLASIRGCVGLTAVDHPAFRQGLAAETLALRVHACGASWRRAAA